MPSNESLSHLIAKSFNDARIETRRFQIIAEICPVPSWLCDPNGKIVFVNDAYVNLTGFTLKELQEDNRQSIFLDDRDKILNSWDKYVADPLSETYTWKEYGRIVRKDGYPLQCLITARKVPSDGFAGNTLPASISPDLLVFDSPLDTFFQLCPDLMVIADENRFFVKVSHAWKDDFGYSNEELLNRPLTELFHPDDVEKTIAADNTIKTGRLIRFYNRVFNKKTQKYHTISWNASQYQNGFTYAVGRDLDASKSIVE